jgi:hypothetical protein
MRSLYPLFWTLSNNVALTPELATIIGEEFGSGADGENAFDGVNGVLGMIEVVKVRRLERPLQPSKQ